MNSIEERISGAKLAERLLGVGGQPRNIDHLIEELRPTTLIGWEGPLLEFKATYKPSPKFPKDPDFGQPDYFIWNVLHAFVAFANACGGCVILGIGETNGQLFEGDWDPDGVLQDAEREEKDLEGRLQKLFFRANDNGARKLSFTRNRTEYAFCILKDDLPRLEKLVRFYCCRSQKLNCNAIVAIVQPVVRNDKPIGVMRTQDQVLSSVTYYRSPTVAKTLEIKDVTELMAYWQTREPESAFCADMLSRPFKQLPVEHTQFSSVPRPVQAFTGRSKELELLHDICQKGKIPLLQAAGGTGKTQLLLQYSKQHADTYPGGRFFLQLDGVNNWDVLLQQLAPHNRNVDGTTQRKWLNLPEYEQKKGPDGQDQDPVPAALTSEQIIDALSKTAYERGPLLIILDNLDDPEQLFSFPIFSSVFPRGLPTGIHFAASARTAEHVTSRRAPDVTIVTLPDLSDHEAISVLCGEHEPKPEELQLAQDITHMLGNRALYLQRVAWMVDDEHVNHNPHPLKTVKNFISADLLAAVRPLGNDLRTPASLWQWTLHRLGKEPSHNKLTLIIRTIAFYPVAGVPIEILEALWHSDFGRIVGKDILSTVEDGSFERAIQVCLRYKIITVDAKSNRVMMHRLDRLAVQEETRSTAPNSLKHIGEALTVNPCCAPADWVEIAPECPDWMEDCPWELLNEGEILNILLTAPYCERYIKDWSILYSDAWIKLLSASTFFDKHPAWPRAPIDPLALIEAREDLFLSQFDFTRITRLQWLDILTRRPDLYSFCPNPGILYDGCSNLSQYSREQPDWGMLLKEQPQMKAVCQFDKLGGRDWADILRSNPEYSTMCPFDVLGPRDLEYVIKEQPQLVTLCPLDKLTASSWIFISHRHPELVEKCNWEFVATSPEHELVDLLAANPILLKRYGHSLRSSVWAGILSRHPDFCKYAPINLWKNLNHYEWKRVFDSHTHFTSQFLSYGNVDGKWTSCYPWTKIVIERPELIGQCPFSQFCRNDWEVLLTNHPEIIDTVPESMLDLIQKNVHGYGGRVLNSKEALERLIARLGAKANPILLQKIVAKSQIEADHTRRESTVLRRYPEIECQLKPDCKSPSEVKQPSISTQKDKTHEDDNCDSGTQPRDRSTMWTGRPSLRSTLLAEKIPKYLLMDNPQIHAYLDLDTLKERDEIDDQRFNLRLAARRPCFINDIAWVEVADWYYWNLIPFFSLVRSPLGHDADEVVIREYGLDRDAYMWEPMITKNPDYGTADFLKTVFKDWTHALQLIPQIDFQWGKMTSEDWRELMTKYPEYELVCPRAFRDNTKPSNATA